MALYEFEGRRPTIAKTAYIAPSALVIGDVKIGEECYIGHGAILRGDYGSIELGDGTAVEEGAIIHARPDDLTKLGVQVTVGHGAVIHNAVIHDGVTVGMRALVSDFAEVGQGTIVGEMCLVKRGQKIAPKKVVVGIPAREIADVTEKNHDMAVWAKGLYIDLAHRYPEGLKLIPEPPIENAEPLDC